MQLIKVSKEVNFTYPKESKYTYCVPEGLTISQEKMYSIAGISGSGKSTILTLLAGLRRFNQGAITYHWSSSKDKSIMVNAENWSKKVGPHFWRNIGFSFQKPELLRALPVGMNLKLALGENYEEMALTLFESNEWNKIKNSRTWQISGGQVQRLGIIRAFGQNQNLVFMDEPTNNLDKSNRERLVKFIQEYGKGKAIVLVSHDKLFLDMLKIEATFEVREEGESSGHVKRVLCQVASPTVSETVQLASPTVREVSQSETILQVEGTHNPLLPGPASGTESKHSNPNRHGTSQKREPKTGKNKTGKKWKSSH